MRMQKIRRPPPGRGRPPEEQKNKDSLSSVYPMRINKYLAREKYCTRREGDALVERGSVFINGRRAVLGDKILESDKVEVRFRVKKYRYFAYNKPRGIITHSAGEDEKDIEEVFPIKGVFPLGRLDKDSCGLIILTDDGRITDKLLNPKYEHEKEYAVETKEILPLRFEEKMKKGVNIEGYMTKPSRVEILGERKFSIVLTEGKKHQVRRMCAALGCAVSGLERFRIMNIKLGGLKSGKYREIKGAELSDFLKSLGF